MADFARAMSTPPPDTTKPQAATPAPAPTPFATPQPAAQGRGEKAGETRAVNAAREAKNERDRQRRAAKRAADAKAKAKKAAPKKKKVKAKKKRSVYAAAARVHALTKDAVAPKRQVGKSPLLAAPYGKKRRRGRPPGAKNKPKVAADARFSSVTPIAATPLPGSDAFTVINTVMHALNTLPVTKRIDVLSMLNRLFG